MHFPKAIQTIFDLIENNQGEVFLVGGCVRDFLNNETPHDYDLATSLLPETVVALFRNHKYSVILTGMQHGTVTVIIDGVGYEITTYRIESDYSDSRHPDKVSFVSDITLDLSRRDLTINAMAYNPKKGIYDPFKGQEDLKNNIIRTVGSPIKRFQEDALRMLRAIRFAAKYGFSIEENTFSAIKENASSITLISKERIRDELCKILMTKNPHYIQFLQTTGLLQHILPEVNQLFFVEQNNPHHIYNVGSHTIMAVKSAEEDLNLRLALLFHDIGKADTKSTDENGIDHFYGHCEVSLSYTTEILKRLKFSTAEIQEITKLVYLHELLIAPTKISIKRYFHKNELSEFIFFKLIKMRTADILAQNPIYQESKLKELEMIKETYLSIANEPMKISSLKVDGHDMMAIGFKERNIGEILKQLLNLVIEDASLNEKTFLLKIAKEKFLENCN